MAVSDTADLVVVGAGVVGLSLADEALLRGLRVVVLDRDAQPSGASVRNFGHGCVTAQTGEARAFAEDARRRWLELRDQAGISVQECGTVVVARREEESAVLAEFARAHPDEVELLGAQDVLELAPVAGAAGGALLPRDIRVDPRAAMPALAAFLRDRGADLRFGTSVLQCAPGLVRTQRGDIRAGAVAITVGHDLDRLLPDLADEVGLRRCSLHMLRVANPTGRQIAPAVLTGTSLLRYSGFTACPSTDLLRQAIGVDRPELLEHGVNLMLTEHSSGDLLVGDTHSYDDTVPAFSAESVDELLLDEASSLFGVDGLVVRERWLGTYAWAPDRDFLVEDVVAGVRAVAVTSGIGMTTALGLAPRVLDGLLGVTRPATTRSACSTSPDPHLEDLCTP